MRKIVCLIILTTLLSSVSAQCDEDIKANEPLKVYPSFSPSMSNPSFTVEFINDGNEVIDIAKLFSEESIILDGKEYKRQIFMWGGISTLHPQDAWSHTVYLSEFLPGAIIEGKFQDVLEAGKHTIIIKFSGYESPSMVFEWLKKVQ